MTENTVEIADMAVTSTEPAKLQGMEFKGKTRKNLCAVIKEKGDAAFFWIQTLGGVGLVLSGIGIDNVAEAAEKGLDTAFDNAAQGTANAIVSGNPDLIVDGLVEGAEEGLDAATESLDDVDNAGRAATGALNVGRNAGSGVTEKVARTLGANRDATMGGLMGAAAGTNVPQLLEAENDAEMAASTVIVAAYTLKSMSHGLDLLHARQEKRANANEFEGEKVATKSSIVGTTLNWGAEKLDKGASYVLDKAQKSFPFLLGMRAAGQIYDGVLRKDITAMVTGGVFMVGALACGLRDWVANEPKIAPAYLSEAENTVQSTPGMTPAPA